MHVFDGAGGGTGDQQLDTAVVRNLRKIVDLPEGQVASFLQSRRRGDALKLLSVLRDLPGTDWPGSTGPPGRAGSKHQRKGAGAADRAAAALLGGSYQSAYEEHFSPRSSRGGAVLGNVFDGPLVRSTYAQQLKEWTGGASDSQNRVLGDTLRTLRWVREQCAGQTTTNRGELSNHGREALDSPRRKVNGRNISMVPLGSLYAPPQTETKAYDKGEATEKSNIDGVWENEKDVRSGRLVVGGARSLLPHCRNHKNLDQGFPTDSWKSESRASWLSEVHGSEQVQRFGSPRSARGFCERSCLYVQGSRPLPAPHSGSALDADLGHSLGSSRMFNGLLQKDHATEQSKNARTGRLKPGQVNFP